MIKQLLIIKDENQSIEKQQIININKALPDFPIEILSQNWNKKQVDDLVNKLRTMLTDEDTVIQNLYILVLSPNNPYLVRELTRLEFVETTYCTIEPSNIKVILLSNNNIAW